MYVITSQKPEYISSYNSADSPVHLVMYPLSPGRTWCLHEPVWGRGAGEAPPLPAPGPRPAQPRPGPVQAKAEADDQVLQWARGRAGPEAGQCGGEPLDPSCGPVHWHQAGGELTLLATGHAILYCNKYLLLNKAQERIKRHLVYFFSVYVTINFHTRSFGWKKEVSQ